MTSELRFAERPPEDDEPGIREWALTGPCGAVSFRYRERDRLGLVLGVHRPVAAIAAATMCDLLPARRCQQYVYFQAAALLGEEFAARSDETAIHGALRAWYEDELRGSS